VNKGYHMRETFPDITEPPFAAGEGTSYLNECLLLKSGSRDCVARLPKLTHNGLSPLAEKLHAQPRIALPSSSIETRMPPPKPEERTWGGVNFLVF